ncbi:MAG TPA: HAMP domain-containing sensor histidine kinase, partial [Longimicrobiales bacterium]|nr:HAMP domain-containing sensor histidine kinase [Longimicrobiales bacterium]
RRVARRLGVGMRIVGPDVDWVSAEPFPALADVDLPPYPGEPGSRAGLVRGLGVSALLERDGYTYLLSLQAGRTALGSESRVDHLAGALFMLAVLGAVYLLTRRLLSPVRVLSEGVERLGRGDLDVEMRTRRTDELGRLVASFNQMARAVRERIRARDQLLLDVSHEIRSPLTRMRVALEMLPDSPAKRSVVEDIEETESMIDELLETERLDSPHGGLARERTDLAALLRDVITAAPPGGPGVELVGADRPVPAEVDPERMRTLAKNVLSNALKYSRPDGPPVRVVLEAEDGRVGISVHDHGVGIDEKDLAYVFEPFYRADVSRSKDTGGYGIGLSLAKRIAEAHGGTIELSSEPGRGTSVVVRLPADANGAGRNRRLW